MTVRHNIPDKDVWAWQSRQPQTWGSQFLGAGLCVVASLSSYWASAPAGPDAEQECSCPVGMAVGWRAEPAVIAALAVAESYAAFHRIGHIGWR